MQTVTHPSATLDARRLERIVAPVREAVRADVLPGAIVAIANAAGVRAQVVIRGARTARLKPDSLFFLASITKPIVATAFMRLVDQGVVDLHAPIERYVPAFTGPGKERVSAWHVLTHTSGISDQDPGVLRRERPTAERMLEMVCRTPLEYEPGSRYQYCSSSFYLIGEVISRFSGHPFPEALRIELLEPAGMRDTSFDPRHDRGRIAPVEGIDVGNRLVRELVLRFLARAALPGGGLWGTAADLLAFGRSMLAAAEGRPNALLSRGALEEMTREHTAGILEQLPDGGTRTTHYALGWAKPRPDGTAPLVVGTSAPVSGTVPGSPRTFTHGGATGTRLWIDPDRDLVFCFLTNLWDAGDGPMYATLAELYEVLDQGHS